MQKEKYHQDHVNDFFQTVLSLKDFKEISCFFRDVLTSKEISDAAERWQIAKLLSGGRMSYREIAKDLGVSTTTVTRVARCLNRGEGGFLLAVRKKVRG